MKASVEPSSCRVALLAGGTSGEREISLASGKGAGEALRQAGFVVDEFDPASKEDLKRLIDGDYDVAFLCMHGKGGEDGRLQGFLETIGLPYTGPGVWSSSTAMNKAKSKLFYQREGIPTAPFIYIQQGEAYDVEHIASAMEGCCVVKPATEGSALGIYIVEGVDAISGAIEEVFKIDNLVVVEKFIKGMEITVAVLGNDDAFALPIIEIVESFTTLTPNTLLVVLSIFVRLAWTKICLRLLRDMQCGPTRRWNVRAYRDPISFWMNREHLGFWRQIQFLV